MDSRRAREVEKLVAKEMGFKRVAFSGGRWDKGKEDIIDEFDPDREGSGTYICQVKATGGKAVKMGLGAVKALLKNARIAHKKPLFVFFFDAEVLEPLWVAMPLDEWKSLESLRLRYEKAKQRRKEREEER